MKTESPPQQQLSAIHIPSLPPVVMSLGGVLSSPTSITLLGRGFSVSACIPHFSWSFKHESSHSAATAKQLFEPGSSYIDLPKRSDPSLGSSSEISQRVSTAGRKPYLDQQTAQMMPMYAQSRSLSSAPKLYRAILVSMQSIRYIPSTLPLGTSCPANLQ